MENMEAFGIVLIAHSGISIITDRRYTAIVARGNVFLEFLQTSEKRLCAAVGRAAAAQDDCCDTKHKISTKIQFGKHHK